MKNEIGRKLTSLTIMAIMFAGGMAIGVPSFMPQAEADTFALTDGMLSVSSEYIQGGAILEIVVNDPDISDTEIDINNGAEITINDTDFIMNQAINGKWYIYVVDDSAATLLDADGNGMEYGESCDTGFSVDGGSSYIVADDDYAIWAETLATSAEAADQAGSCLDADNMIGTLDDSTATVARQLISGAVLQSAPTLSDHNESANDLGQRGHALNASGYGSWPYILGYDLSDDNIIEYGSNELNVEYGNTDDEASINIINNSPAAHAELHMTITDPALNVDPTDVDIWIFDLSETKASSTSIIFANNGTNSEWSGAEQGDHGCEDNCQLTWDASTTGVMSGYTTVSMTESGSNTAIFESFDLNGESQLEVKADAAGDNKTVFDYAGETADVIITYNDATIDFDAGAGDWVSTEVATFTINDPDMNFNPEDDETLYIKDEKRAVPTISMGTGGLSLSEGTNASLQSGDAGATTGVVVGEGTPGTEGASNYGVVVYNTTDNSDRLRILHQSEAGNTAAATSTWINVTTGHTIADIVGLPGTVVLSYNIEGPAGDMSSTDVNVYLAADGDNGTDSGTTSIITIVSDGNVRSGVYDLDDGTDWLKSQDISDHQSWNTGADDNAGTTFVTVAFEITHAAGKDLAATADYAISADFCNFDQNNATGLVHNCTYRIEAEETGDNTGVFEGTVEYITLNNSTTGGSISGEHNGNDHEVESLLTDMGEDGHALVVVQDSVDGVDAIRVIYNDTDALQASTEIGAQLDTMTHTGTADLDADTYEADDMATITIVDADLNQDSAIRDTYQNSSTTFNVTITGSDGITTQTVATSPMTIIETSNDSGVFVGTFTVPDKNGQDMELTYYESRDAGGNSVEFYDIATITSNSGSVSFDRSVYPVPFAANDLEQGDNSTDISDAGPVTATIVVHDADFTADTLTTGSGTGAGTIIIKIIEGTSSQTCFTAGSTVASDASGSVVEELGPLTEIVRDSFDYEVEFTIDESQDCGASNVTVSSGDVIQVSYVDTSDDGGSTSTVYDSSTFDLRTGSLSLDKDVYVLGSDMVLTLTDPDLNLDAGSTETYTTALIEWDSDADSSESLSGTNNFTNNPSTLQETGDDTGVFQTVVTLPTSGIYNDNSVSNTIQTIDFGEAVTLTYADQGLSGEDNVGDDDLDVEVFFSISNFGALVELDQAVYTWTDTVFFTITAPDHNRNTASEEQIGTADLPIQVTTRVGKMCSSGDKTYFGDESGPDTGVFEGEIQLAGFAHTMSSDSGDRTPDATTCGSTNDGGILRTDSQTDGISVSYEYNDAQVVVASASIVWNIGEAYFDTSAVSAGGSAVITVVDPDENLDDDIIDTFTIDVFSDSDNGGFNLDMSETNEDTGVFEGTVFFTSDLASSGSNLRVSEGDTVTAEYTDETLPEPYTTDDDLTIAATTTVGTAFPPLERAPAANARVVDAFGSSVAEVSVDQQVQIAADVSNGQDGDQEFAYLVQVQDSDGVTVSLAWITGSLTAGQSMSPALSWTPGSSGSYTATVFVWESVDNPTALSPTVSVDIDVV